MSKSSNAIGSPLHRVGVAGPVRVCTFRGSGASSGSRSRPLALAAFCILFASLVLSTAPAQAEVLHKYLSQIAEIPATGPHGEAIQEPGPLQQVYSMTFDSGDLWVGERGRFDEFDASGGFVSQLLAPGGGSVAVGHANGETQLV